MNRVLLNIVVILFVALSAKADNIPLSDIPIVVPVENPLTNEKVLLGKILFWDEQLSSDNTVACGSCHLPSSGGADAKPLNHPGTDGIFNTEDDVMGSAGIRSYDVDMRAMMHPVFMGHRQVTHRATPSFINAGFADALFWDGRAGEQFDDPISGEILINQDGALESQSLAPILNSVEMAKAGRTWDDVLAKLMVVLPLALASELPQDVTEAVNRAKNYPTLFAEAFGDEDISPARIAFALASYQRTLIADQTPWDKYIAGDESAMTTAQIAGWNMFNDNTLCGNCHTPPLFSDNKFYNIGLRPAGEDIGREQVTNNRGDWGRFKTPSLRNASLKSSLMHVGWITDVRDSIDFYNAVADEANGIANRHHQFVENQSGIPTDTPGRFADYSNLSMASEHEQMKNNVADFIANALTDPRVANESYPFDRPQLASERKDNESSLMLFMSYNIGGANWQQERAPDIATVIASNAPDVIGFQEAGAIPLADLQPLLADKYHVVSFNNAMPIVYNADKLYLLVSGSSDRDEMLSCVNGRYINHAIFAERATGNQFIFMNSHFCAMQTPSDRLPDGYTAEQVNQQHAVAMANYANQLRESWQLPLVIAGDLNASENSETMNYLLKQDPLGDLANPITLIDTWLDKHTGIHQGVDWLLIDGSTATNVYAAERVENGLTSSASDHYPMIAGLIFNDDPNTNLPADSDGDGVVDEQDAFPFDPNETLDTDGDGVGNNADSDDDGDGVVDEQDAFPLDNTRSADNVVVPTPTGDESASSSGGMFSIGILFLLSAGLTVRFRCDIN